MGEVNLRSTPPDNPINQSIKLRKPSEAKRNNCPNALGMKYPPCGTGTVAWLPSNQIEVLKIISDLHRLFRFQQQVQIEAYRDFDGLFCRFRRMNLPRKER